MAATARLQAEEKMSSMLILFGLVLSFCLESCSAKFLLLVDDNSPTLVSAFGLGMKEYEDSKGKSVDFIHVAYKNDSNWDEVCQAASAGITAVLDATYSKDSETKPQTFFTSKNVPYFKVDVPMDNLMVGAKEMLESKGASNGFLIFHNQNDVSRGIHNILGHTLIRFAFLDASTMSKLIDEKFEYRIPSAVVLFGTGKEFDDFIRTRPQVFKRDLLEWVFMYNGFPKSTKHLNISFPTIRGYFDGALCCKLQPGAGSASSGSGGNCDPNQCSGDPAELYLRKLAVVFSAVLAEADPNGSNLVKLGCDANNKASGNAAFKTTFGAKLSEKSEGLFSLKDDHMSFTSTVKFDQSFNNSVTAVGAFDSATGFAKASSYAFRTRQKYYRIGIVDYPPWTYWDAAAGNWTGYCIELARGIAEKMNFTYDLVVSEGFGHRDNVTMRWDGLTGDLIHGKIDIAVAAYIMTSEREEFIDFVSPYYEQSGLIITMKKPVVKNSLFKFMTVLRPEVWFSIAGATIATGFMLWFLDKFSPYSAQNNPHKYKSFRKFTLKESFWFALTSFTPQGGGEPPKAFSGRTLVAAYWIFVVLMLATFTANLAAFLTVERMQSPIRNLEHLAGQSSVKYSVVNGSTAQRFFNNMAKAEDTLYQMWRNLTLSAPSSAKEYIVWEYPIREMYIHINSVIQKTGEVEDARKGFDKVLADEYYAFIHDAAQTRYEVYQNCSLTLIGEAFAESPYAIAVAQGNPLQDDISMAILDLQTNRFFESLSSKYWNSKCQSLSDGESDGISLESLGGVFIATIIGLGIAFISLAIEVFTTARNRRKAKIEAEKIANKTQFLGPMDFYGTKIKKAEAINALAIKRGHFMPEVIN